VDEEGVSGGVSCGLGLADRNSKLCNSMHNLLLCTSSSPITIRKTLDLFLSIFFVNAMTDNYFEFCQVGRWSTA